MTFYMLPIYIINFSTNEPTKLKLIEHFKFLLFFDCGIRRINVFDNRKKRAFIISDTHK